MELVRELSSRAIRLAEAGGIQRSEGRSQTKIWYRSASATGRTRRSTRTIVTSP